MNERFLFRGRQKDNRKWAEGYFDYHETINRVIITKNGFIHEVENETVGQCTGLRDKNGKLIFEGDILSLGNKKIPHVGNFAVTWQAKWGNWGTLNSNGVNCFAVAVYKENEREIIGNIFDNPELLEVE